MVNYYITSNGLTRWGAVSSTPKTYSDQKYNWTRTDEGFEGFVELINKSQTELKKHLYKTLEKAYGKGNAISGDGYLYAMGDIPVILVSHMDTVQGYDKKEIYAREEFGDVIITSPTGIGGDDRCGIWIITKLLEFGYRPTVIFTEDEEIGCVGASKLADTKKYASKFKGNRYIIELDRRGNNDAVYYDLDNKDFERYITAHTGRMTAIGSCSDISHLAPALGIAAVNFSVGYYNEHHLDEEVNINDMVETLRTVIELLQLERDCENGTVWEYKEKKYNYYGSSRSNYYNWYDEDDDYGYYKTTTLHRPIAKKEKAIYEVSWEVDSVEKWTDLEADSYYEALGLFMESNPDVCYNDVICLYDVSKLEREEV